MAISKDKKETIVSKLKTVSDSAKGIVFVSFTKVPVTLATELRKKLGQEGVGYFVAKKTLLRRAFAEKGFAGDMPDLPGEVAVAFGEDPLVSSKSIYAYQKSNPEQFSIVGGIYDGAYVDREYMTALAKVPGREVLYGQLAYLFNWPVQSLAIALSEISKKQGGGEVATAEEVPVEVVAEEVAPVSAEAETPAPAEVEVLAEAEVAVSEDGAAAVEESA